MDGGGIFEYLPQKGTPHFDYLFSTAQGLDYSGLATLYGIDFVRVSSNDELKNALQNYVGTVGVHVIESPHLKNEVGNYMRYIRRFLQTRRTDYEPICLQYYR